jgi:hypothetical protein
LTIKKQEQHSTGEIVDSDRHARGPRGVVVAHVPHPQDHASLHERRTLAQFARQLAALLGYEDGGFYDARTHYDAALYFVPASTLTSPEAQALGIDGVDQLFGGVVPHAFVGTKVISHPLVASDAQAVAGWDPHFAVQTADCVLPGFSVFSPADARSACKRLLGRGPVRLKPALASGGRAQSVVRDIDELEAVLEIIDQRELSAHGLVVEEQLNEVLTLSVGQVRVAELTATYHGVQNPTRDNRGDEVFGGSELTVARGGFDALLALHPRQEVRGAIEQAQRFHAAVHACFPGFYASRCNYDILRGRDAAGAMRMGVLEQSWRVGGATGPELAALQVFRAQPKRRAVRASCVEIFGDSPDPPPDATVYFRGDDPSAGPLTKYTVVHSDVDPR